MCLSEADARKIGYVVDPASYWMRPGDKPPDIPESAIAKQPPQAAKAVYKPKELRNDGDEPKLLGTSALRVPMKTVR